MESYFVNLPSRFRRAKWLSRNNRYRVDCTSVFDGDARVPAGFSADQHKQLTAYVSASSPAHAIDGWSFLGRAIDSALRGDSYSAAHFAYYAELRATMSLFASQGIGIFNANHAIISIAGIACYPPRIPPGNSRVGTHKIIWPLLRYWSSLSRAGELLDQLIQPEQIRLSKWLDEMNSPVRVRAVGQDWLDSWGLDLAAVEEDHDVRNLASYRPSEFRLPRVLPSAEIVDFVVSLWTLFEPGTDRRFHQIERCLLKSAWKAGGTPLPSQNELEQVGLTPAEATNWSNFLSLTNDPLPLTLAEATAPIEDSTCHMRMISRAALLLFVASGAARRMLLNANYSTETIAFWWKQHGIDRGLWTPANIPADPLDIWADVAIAIADLTTWRRANAGASLRDLRLAQQQHIPELGALELIGIWSLLP